MKTHRILYIFLMIALVQWGCSDDDSSSELVLPSNLSVEITADTVNENIINVAATADQVNFFSIIFIEDGVVTPRKTNDGLATYTYGQEGEYTIIIRAHSLEDEYIEQRREVTIGDVGSGGSGIPTTGYTTPLSYPGRTLVWQDEFNGTELSTADWNYEIGTGTNGWGNNELQYYLRENTSVADGVLKIEAKSEPFGGSNYTSSRLTTQNKRTFKFGRIDIRAALPEGQGLWPALWMLGESISSVGWPKCGEIDIMEMVGGTTTTDRGDGVVHGTAHWEDDNTGLRALFGDHNRLSSGSFSDEFHVFSIIWDSQKIEWYRDDIKYNTLDITPAELSEFNQEFFFLFNVAVGGDWPGSPDNTTVFPQSMYVDYVRVFQ